MTRTYLGGCAVPQGRICINAPITLLHALSINLQFSPTNGQRTAAEQQKRIQNPRRPSSSQQPRLSSAILITEQNERGRRALIYKQHPSTLVTHLLLRQIFPPYPHSSCSSHHPAASYLNLDRWHALDILQLYDRGLGASTQ